MPGTFLGDGRDVRNGRRGRNSQAQQRLGRSSQSRQSSRERRKHVLLRAGSRPLHSATADTDAKPRQGQQERQGQGTPPAPGAAALLAAARAAAAAFPISPRPSCRSATDRRAWQPSTPCDPCGTRTHRTAPRAKGGAGARAGPQPRSGAGHGACAGCVRWLCITAVCGCSAPATRS